MFSWYHAYRIEKQRRDEEIIYAEQERLMKDGRPRRGIGIETGANLYHTGLNRLGGILVRWGSRMQAGYQRWADFHVEESGLMQKPGPCP